MTMFEPTVCGTFKGWTWADELPVELEEDEAEVTAALEPAAWVTAAAEFEANVVELLNWTRFPPMLKT